MIFGGAAIAKLRLFCFFYRQPLLSPSFFFFFEIIFGQ